MAVTATGSFELKGTGLNPNDKLEASATFTPNEGQGQGKEVGFSVQHVKTDGTIKFTMPIDNITGGRSGSVRAWLRSKGSTQFADPIQVNGEAQEVTITV